MQLCITEDMRVFAEHKITFYGGERREIAQRKVWQGDASTTVKEALRSLQVSEPAGSASVSSSPTFSWSSTRERDAVESSATVVDVSRGSNEEARNIVHYVERTYPDLKLLVHHTSGKDLQGTKLHTIHVELVPRGGRTSATPLPDEAQRLMDSFKGESVGEGYHGCLRRALRDAFAAAQIPYPPLSSGAADASTVLSLFAQTWAQDGFQLHVSTCHLLSDSVELVVRHPSHGQVLGSATLPLTAAGLRDLFPFCERVAASYKPGCYTNAKQRIQRSPLHLVLPRSQLRVKHLLRKLLHYFYGCTDDDITFGSHATSEGVYTAKIGVRLPSATVTYDDAAHTPLFAVAKTTGTACKKAMELAAVQAMQALFPDVFEKQIAYHPEVREIQQSDKASATVSMPPPLSRGLEVQLRWALQGINADFVVESVLLKQNTPYPLWGVTTGTTAAWLSQLFLLKPPPSSSTTATTATVADGDGAAAGGVVRELCAYAFDSRKSRSEQKVMAAALARHFPELCKASIAHAKERNLIDDSGAATAFEGVQSLQESDAERFAAALSADPCLTSLTPTCSSVLQPLPDCGVRNSALEFFWTSVAGHGTEQLTVRVQRRQNGASGDAYCASCSTAAPGGVSEPDRLLGEATATTEIGALLTLLEATWTALCQHLPDVGAGTAVHAAKKEEAKAEDGSDAHGIGSRKSTAEFLAGVPTSLPTSTPLQTCVDAVCRLYGLRCSVRITQEGAQYGGELWGSFPVDSAVLRRYERVASSPFFIERMFLLGRGHAELPFMAVVRAAQHVFESHVRVHQHAFHDAVVTEGLLHLHPGDDGCLAQLRDAVLSEIKATSDKALTDSALVLRFHHGELFEFTFSVSSGARSVKLEEAVSRRFLDGAREFCTRVSGETGVEFLPRSALSAIAAHTPEQALRQLCRLAYGLELRVELQQVHTVWHCRLSIPLTGELACCVAESSACRKKTALDRGAMHVLKRHFASEFAQIADCVTMKPSHSSDTEDDAVQASMDNYVFQVSHAADEVAASSPSGSEPH